MNKLLLTLFVISSVAFSVIKEGETVPNWCWDDVNGKKVCIDDYKSNVKVLIYSAGWCGPCKNEMAELSGKVKKFFRKDVVFFSLSSQGWTGNSPADATFLKSWKTKFNLNFGKDIQFVVAAAQDDFGRNFFSNPGIPNVAILDKNNKLTFKGMGVPVDEMFDKILELNP